MFSGAGTVRLDGTLTIEEGVTLSGAGTVNVSGNVTGSINGTGLVSDNLQGDCFRHATKLVRWRPDREPASCTYAQLDRPVPEELAAVFGA